VQNNAYPRYILPQGDGYDVKGLKCEWMAVKDDKLLVGSIGKEWTTADGRPLHNQLYWVKEIDAEGRIRSLNWTDQFERVRAAADKLYPSYLVHEAIGFDQIARRWVLLPRRESAEAYDAADEEGKGSNIVIIADEGFNKISTKRIGDRVPTHGYASFKFIPHRHNEVVALKSVEDKGKIETYIIVLDIDNDKVLLEETKVADKKFEGVEFV